MTYGSNHIKDVRQLAQEASTENDPEKLMSLIPDLNEALAIASPLTAQSEKFHKSEGCPPG